MNEIAIPDSFKDRAYAREKFRDIVRWARANHPFYRTWLEDADRHVPLMTRTDVLEHNDRLLNGHRVTATTSGSTGVPVKIAWDRERQKVEAASTTRFVEWLGGRMTVTRFIHIEKPAADCLDVKSKVADQLALIEARYRSNGANAIKTYPSNAERISHAVLDRKIDMSYVKRFGVYAEVFEPRQEQLIRQAFPNAQIWSTYSAQEVGMIAGRCPHNPEFHHVMAGKLGVEILNDDDQPCRNGELGRVVITDFYNRTAPFIRYDIGDLAAWGTCPCGRIDFPALATVLGKIRGSLMHRNGERVPFTELSVALRDIPGMRQYQVIQESLEDFTVRLVNTRGQLSNELVAEIEQAFQHHFGYLPELSLSLEPVIGREDSGKFYSSICRI